MTDELVGREVEQALVRELIDALPGGGDALVLRGEAGVGKSALVAWAAEQAAQAGTDVLTVTGVQAEFDFAYAGLHRLIGQLPAGGAAAGARTTVSAAIATAGPERTPVLVGLAFLELVTAAAASRPVLIVVDDAHWLDAASWEALTFVARRLQSDPVLLVAALRDGAEAQARQERGGLPELRVAPLADDRAAALLDRRAPDLRPELRSRVLTEAAGNPLGLVELAEVASRYGARGLPPAVLPLSTRLERTFARLVAELPAATQTLLLVAAVDDRSGVDEIVAAAQLLATVTITADDLQPAVVAGLIEIDAPLLVRFRHPLVRSALSQGGALARRRSAHAALATLLADQPERQIWHRAEAAAEPDERLAADLTRAATEARQHSPWMAMTALERAAQLSEDPQEAASRVLWAAVAAHELGDIEATIRLLRSLEQQHLRSTEQARLAWMREIFLTSGWSGASRVPAFVEIIGRMRKDGEIALALESLVAISLRVFWSNPDRETRELVLGEADKLSADPLDAQYVSVLALVGPRERGEEVLAGIEYLLTQVVNLPQHLELLANAASAVGDLPTAQVFIAAAVSATRGQGRLGSLAQALLAHATFSAQLGDVRLAVATATEARELALETGQPRWALTADLARGYAEALRGNSAVALELADAGEGALLPIGAHPMLALVQLIRGAEALADGRHLAAYEHLHRIFDPAEVPFHPVVQFWAANSLAEAAIGCGRGDDLRELMEELTPWAHFPVLRVALSYAEALLATDDEAEAIFERALGAGFLTAWPFERARMEHAFGTWLRRQRRAAESRPHLRTAINAFEALGARPWADRARAELRASGERVRRHPDARDQLTPQELQIAQLAADGLSNREIGERLYLSPRTVSTHLYRIFPKLGVTSRAEVARALLSP